jgi:uncharacterized membrane protein
MAEFQQNMNYKNSMIKRIIRYFFQGLIFFAPSAATLYILYIVFTYVDNFIQSFMLGILPFKIPGLGIVVILILITFLGFIGQSILFRPFAMMVDRLFQKAPLIRVLYSSIRDLLSAFVGKEKKFNKPVLVKVNTVSELEKMGFITNEDLSDLNIKDKVAVYFPHSYNFSGEMFIVPKELVRPVSISSSEAMKFIVSGGVTKV